MANSHVFLYTHTHFILQDTIVSVNSTITLSVSIKKPYLNVIWCCIKFINEFGQINRFMLISLFTLTFSVLSFTVFFIWIYCYSTIILPFLETLITVESFFCIHSPFWRMKRTLHSSICVFFQHFLLSFLRKMSNKVQGSRSFFY
jgi:hypothetical protein